MAGLSQLRSRLLRDRKITTCEVDVIRDHIRRDGRLDIDDVRFLVELLSDARDVCPEFDDLFFPALKQVVLEDGHVDEGERFHLLKMLYADGRIRPSEKRFLDELRRDARELTPAFDAMCETACAADETNWCVGGR